MFCALLLTLITLISCAQGHLLLDDTKLLQPVHGLFVKPSTDGTTGDLYVAASEDNGIQSQWLTDKPVSFLPVAAKQPQQKSSKTQPVAITSSVTKSITPNDETISSKKITVINSPGIKYAYALPIPGADGNLLTSYPFALPTSMASTEGSSIPTTEVASHVISPDFYHYMLSALVNAITALKDEASIELKSPGTSRSTTSWPHTYPYPYQYVMLDPNIWQHWSNKQIQSATISETSKESI